VRDAFAATIEREMTSDRVAFNDGPKAHAFNDSPPAHAFNDSPPAHMFSDTGSPAT
jgi:hypothetical protein